MGRMKEKPRYNVLSVRLSDEEMQAVKDAADEDSVSASTLVRNILMDLLGWRC